MLQPVSQGAPRDKSASSENYIRNAANYVNQTMNGGGGGSIPGGPNNAPWTLVLNSTGTARDQFECVELGDVQIKGSGSVVDGNLQLLLAGNTPAAGRHLGILQAPCGSGSTTVVRAWVGGVHPALVNVTNTSHRRADSGSGSYVLQSNMVGQYEILNTISGSGQQTCIVHKSGRSGIKLFGLTGSGGIDSAAWGGSELTPGTATVTLYLRDHDSGKYDATTITETFENIADAIEGDKGITATTDDDGIPIVDVEPCDLTKS